MNKKRRFADTSQELRVLRLKTAERKLGILAGGIDYEWVWICVAKDDEDKGNKSFKLTFKIDFYRPMVSQAILGRRCSKALSHSIDLLLHFSLLWMPNELDWWSFASHHQRRGWERFKREAMVMNRDISRLIS